MAGSSRSDKQRQQQELLESDLYLFAKWINPHYAYGDIHEEVFHWLQGEGPHGHQLLLMPRGHLKSHCIAVWCVWQITKNPATSIVYLSAGEDLATLQIGSIKHMITCDRYRKVWPDMVHREEGKREKWAAWGFSVDHPFRKKMGTRDLTIIVKTIKSNFVGLHCDIMVYDDVVVDNNAYTEIGRKEVSSAISRTASIKNPGAITKAVGTLYHPADVYHDFKSATIQPWDNENRIFGEEEDLWDIVEYEAEDSGGELTGTYLWPRTVNPTDSRKYGFDPQTLGNIMAQYFSLGNNAQFWSQYYNNTNDPGSEKVSRDSFQYYNPARLTNEFGTYYYSGRKLNLSAAMDVAWTTNKKSDYTAIAVIGVDCEWNIYVLALERFKTQDYDVYYEYVEGLHQQFEFKRLHVETNAGGTLVASELSRRLRQNGSILQIQGKPSTGNEGKKEEKHAAVLIPRVKNGQVFFSKGGLTQVAIEEIVLERPPHDDLKDVLTSAISQAKPAANTHNKKSTVVPLKSHRRFGGVYRG
jgi:phage terminase large subunit-like protein